MVGITAAAAVVVNVWFIVANWYAVAPRGHDAGLTLVVLLAFPIVIALLLALVTLPAALIPRLRRIALQTFVAAAIYAAIGVKCLRMGGEVREQAFERLAERSKPLVAAIERFEAERGRPPSSLAELVPRHLPAIPSTGMGAYPQYEYVTGEKARSGYAGNEWVLVVHTPAGLLNWDMFLYYPRGNYPARGFSGSFHRIGDWAYVYE